jgi:hypothetical protein
MIVIAVASPYRLSLAPHHRTLFRGRSARAPAPARINRKYDNLTLLRQGWRDVRQFAQFVQGESPAINFVALGQKQQGVLNYYSHERAEFY